MSRANSIASQADQAGRGDVSKGIWERVEGVLQDDLEAGPVPLVGIGECVVSYMSTYLVCILILTTVPRILDNIYYQARSRMTVYGNPMVKIEVETMK